MNMSPQHSEVNNKPTIEKGASVMKTLSQLTDFEFRSNEEINGLPLIHINIGTNPDTGRPLSQKV